MKNLNKTIITYQGGSAGDFFVKSCNGESIAVMDKFVVNQPSTLKEYEQKIKEGISIDLETELINSEYEYVSTHLFDSIIDKWANIISIVIDDPQVQLTTIYRQLQVQKPRMKVDETDEWFINTRNFCTSGQYEQAAMYWFDNNKKYWLDNMQIRLQDTKLKKINFNKLFTTEFVANLQQQGWTHNIDVLKYNHNLWLQKNSFFSYENTIASLSKKLSSMNWNLQTGWIKY